MLIGKPTANRFICGDEREITPTARLIATKNPVMGNIIIAAAKNIDPAAVNPPATSASRFGKVPTGIN